MQFFLLRTAETNTNGCICVHLVRNRTSYTIAIVIVAFAAAAHQPATRFKFKTVYRRSAYLDAIALYHRG